MASERNLCVICQDAIDVGDNTMVPLPCMHTYHRECIKVYVASKEATNQNIECPVCRQQSFQHGTMEYNAFCMSLRDSLPSDTRTQVIAHPRSVRSVTETSVPQVSISVYEIRPFHIPEQRNKGCKCSLGWIFLLVLLIVLTGISIWLVTMFT
jgi:hypothetical protein